MKKRIKEIVIFLFIQSICIPLFSFLLIYYGPFENIRGTIVYTAMHTSNHKYLAQWFLSESDIETIIEKYKSSVEKESQNISDVIVENKNSKIVEVIEVYTGMSRGKLMIVDNPFRIFLSVSDGIGKHGSTLSEMVYRNNALGGINGGAYLDEGATTKGGTPGGVIVNDGELLFFEETEYEHCVMGFDKNGILIIKTIKTPEDVNAMNLEFAVSFGPQIISNGKGLVVDAGAGLQPRTAIAQRKDGTVLLLALDGRQAGSAGANLKNVQDVLLENGAYNAGLLDGGSSTTMVFKGEVVNVPSERGLEKYLPTAFLVSTGDG